MKKKPAKPRRWNSTIPISAKKPARGSRPVGRGKRPNKVNPIRQAKRRASYAKKLAAYRKSETYKIVEARAGGRCEGMDTYITETTGRLADADFATGKGLRRVKVAPYRCYADSVFGGNPKLSHHHKTYARFGGDELPEDMIVLCERHHAMEEAKHPNRKHGR